MSGTQFQKSKEDAAAIMREKQRKGRFRNLVEKIHPNSSVPQPTRKSKPKQQPGKRNNPDAPIPIYLAFSVSDSKS
jgi:hypothetical protein